MTKYLYFISGLSQIGPNLPVHYLSFFLHLLWMIVTLAAPIEAPLWSPSCKIKTNPGTFISKTVHPHFLPRLTAGA